MDLPLPDRPASATTSPGDTVSAKPSSTSAPRPWPHDTSSKTDLAAHPAERDRRGRVHHFARFVQDLVHALQRHPRGPQSRVEPHQALDRADQADLVGHERG